MQIPPAQAPTAPATVTGTVSAEVAKSQAVRLLDVALFGPLMIMGALDKRPPAWMRLALVGIGAGTILYNLQNYLDNAKRGHS